MNYTLAAGILTNFSAFPTAFPAGTQSLSQCYKTYDLNMNRPWKMYFNMKKHMRSRGLNWLNPIIDANGRVQFGNIEATLL